MRSFASGRPGVPSMGVGTFTEKLAEKISDIRYDTEVIAIEPGTVKTDSGEFSADSIIVATNKNRAINLLPEIARAAKLDQYRDLESTTWYHVTRGELQNADLLAVQKSGAVVNSAVISDLISGYAPTGKTLIASTTLQPTNEVQVRDELSRIWQISTHDWQLLAEYKIPYSLTEHLPGKAMYSKQYQGNGIYLAGDYLTYPSQQGAMESGRLAAEEIIRRAR